MRIFLCACAVAIIIASAPWSADCQEKQKHSPPGNTVQQSLSSAEGARPPLQDFRHEPAPPKRPFLRRFIESISDLFWRKPVSTIVPVYPLRMEWSGNKFKGQLHAHSTNSDGEIQPRDAVEYYRNLGYDFISITDHDQDDADENTLTTVDHLPPGFVFLPGIENSLHRHLLSINIPSRQARFDGTGISAYQDLIDETAHSGGFTILAHPNWALPDDQPTWTTDIMLALRGFIGIEVFNTSNYAADKYAEDRWNELLSAGRIDVLPVATDDCHFGNLGNCNRGWISVFAESQTEEALVDGILHGNFYASSGCEFRSIIVNGATLSATPEAIARIEFVGCNGSVRHSTVGTSASFDIPQNEYLYIRLTDVFDPQRQAWSRAFSRGKILCGNPPPSPKAESIVQATLNWRDDKIYFFRGDHYLRYDMGDDRADDGYPKPIGRNWLGVWIDGIDAAVDWGNGKAYFFKGSQYIRYDREADVADPGYPKPIAGHWPGVWEDGIDAVIRWDADTAYFFKGGEYIRYDIASDRAVDGYPRPIAGNWPGLSFGRIDAVVHRNNSWMLPFIDGKVYFFRGSRYLRYDRNNDAADPGYPADIDDDLWPGLDALIE